MSRTDISRFLGEVEAELGFIQPRLTCAIEGSVVVVEGEFMVVPTMEEHRDHGAIARHPVRIEIDPSYPAIAPRVFSIGDSIERTEANHCSADGLCCVLVWETWRATANDISLRGYFEGPLRNFFLGQFLVARGEPWPFGEWDHHRKGLLDAYAELLGCPAKAKTVKATLRLLLMLLDGREMPVLRSCPCGSLRRLDLCCAARLETLCRTISREDVQAMLDALERQRQNEGNKACLVKAKYLLRRATSSGRCPRGDASSRTAIST